MIGLFIGLLLGGALFMGPLKPVGTNGQVASISSEKQISNAANSPISSNSTAISDEDSTGTVKQILQGAKAQIQTEDMASYYDKLIAAYDLDNPNPNQSASGLGALSSIVDIQKINYAAMSMPLIEAGKNIKDADIARFYYKFLQDTGWDIKP
jgi:hypothetical protein